MSRVIRFPGGYRFPRLAFAAHCLRRWTIDLAVDAYRLTTRRSR